MESNLSLFNKAFNNWKKDNTIRMAAALSYYTIFSLAPLLFVIVNVTGIIFGKTVVEQQLLSQARSFLGPQAAVFIQMVLENTGQPKTNTLATIIGIIILIIGASSVFGQLQQSLNSIWNVRIKSGLGLVTMLRYKFLSIAMIAAIGFLLLVSLVISVVLNAFGSQLQSILLFPQELLLVLNFLTSLILTTFLFSLIFKVLPDIHLSWNYVWLPALVTAMLFTVGRQLIILYISYSDLASIYGAAGSVMIMLIWVYYAAWILYYGAELTKVLYLQNNSVIVPSRYAESLSITREKTIKLSGYQKELLRLGGYILANVIAGYLDRRSARLKKKN